MRYSGDHKAKTRERVLREAARELRAKGRDNVSVARVMERAGLTHGGFYAHFSSKDDLVAEAVATMFDDARARLAATTDDEPRRALRAYIDFYLSAAHRDNRERGCPLPALSGDLARADPAARERFGAGVKGLSDRLAQLLRAIGSAAPDAEASAMLAQMVGAVALSRAVADSAQSDAILADARADLVARYNLETAQ
ncbi:MAG: TetR/AcrR family transcriptional regulator [Sphingomonas sp.]|uniref:TetR/AcrR family transcriptional regulator n=1 Tax=Sphingomonas sp. TaxID=28214 RepID=UPI001AC3B6C8|nr:TetR/AcrR family transcriptional regulator [Sphingomonas sp.]MBN8816376.1 TetR/AcrR family transcriptional regulator [Sphingomonas sp.]